MDCDINPFQVWIMKLAKEGYGSYEEMRNLDVRSFINLIHYENYLNKYQDMVQWLNRKD